jgi:phosphatidate cytidylyltransferase
MLVLPFAHHLLLNIGIVVLSGMGGWELAVMFRSKGIIIAPVSGFLLAMLSPFASMLELCLGLSATYSFGFGAGVLTLGVLCIFGFYIFASKEAIENSLHKLMAAALLLIYPGVLLSWAVRFSAFQDASALLVVFVVLVIGNDSVAWAAGMLFGKGNRGLVAASPNKSIAGFAGGTIASIILAIFIPRLFPGTFVPRFMPAPLALALLGLFSGLAAIAGDLAESVIKRSCGVKDSGVIIPGRGGVLDSIDSHAMAAPVFYFVYWLLFI